MKDRSGFRIAIGLVLVVALIAAAAALGWMAYNAGLAQGAAQAAGAPLGPPGMYGPHFMAPFGFGFLGCLVPLAFLFLVFSLFRLVAWGGMGRHWHGGWGPGRGFMPEGMKQHWRERMEEWHREAHSTASGKSTTDNPPA